MSKEDSTSEQKCKPIGYPYANPPAPDKQWCETHGQPIGKCSFSEAAAEDQNSNNAAHNSSGPRTESPHSARERIWVTWDDCYAWNTPETGGDEYVRAPQWQLIETAPPQGNFLVYMPNEPEGKQIQVASWHPNVKVIGHVFAFDLTSPTHWAALPALPEVNEPARTKGITTVE